MTNYNTVSGQLHMFIQELGNVGSELSHTYPPIASALQRLSFNLSSVKSVVECSYINRIYDGTTTIATAINATRVSLDHPALDFSLKHLTESGKPESFKSDMVGEFWITNRKYWQALLTGLMNLDQDSLQVSLSDPDYHYPLIHVTLENRIERNSVGLLWEMTDKAGNFTCAVTSVIRPDSLKDDSQRSITCHYLEELVHFSAGIFQDPQVVLNRIVKPLLEQLQWVVEEPLSLEAEFYQHYREFVQSQLLTHKPKPFYNLDSHNVYFDFKNKDGEKVDAFTLEIVHGSSTGGHDTYPEEVKFRISRSNFSDPRLKLLINGNYSSYSGYSGETLYLDILHPIIQKIIQPQLRDMAQAIVTKWTDVPKSE